MIEGVRVLDDLGQEGVAPIFGYRTVSVATARRGDKHSASARFEINANEAASVERIFRDHAAGQSMQAIAFALNREGVRVTAQDRQRGPHRRGWAVSSVRVILRNEKHAGLWIWSKQRFVKCGAGFEPATFGLSALIKSRLAPRRHKQRGQQSPSGGRSVANIWRGSWVIMKST